MEPFKLDVLTVIERQDPHLATAAKSLEIFASETNSFVVWLIAAKKDSFIEPLRTELKDELHLPTEILSHFPNQRMSKVDSFNEALEVSKADYIMTLAPGNFFHSRPLAKLCDIVAKNELAWGAGELIKVSEASLPLRFPAPPPFTEGHIIAGTPRTYFEEFEELPFHAASTLVKRTVLLEAGGFQDHEFGMGHWLEGPLGSVTDKYPGYFLAEPVMFRRASNASETEAVSYV